MGWHWHVASLRSDIQDNHRVVRWHWSEDGKLMKVTIDLHCVTVDLKFLNASQTAVASRAVQFVYCVREWCVAAVVFNVVALCSGT